MSERSIMVRLRANVADFKTQINSAGTSLDDLAKKGDKTGEASKTAMGKMAQSAQLQRESWTTAGTALVGVGAGMLAVTGLVAKAGIEYNTLQQKSKAALTTILGSGEAAEAQLEKFNAFAKTSPFAKDVFLKAQQQMLGFGIEAKKVIPFLSAINEAVAATGGSNEDISQLTRIFSQVQAAQKITAVDLMQFGQRGVDAAALIGSQMGKTGAEIREGITAGTIPAGEALDALAAGMQQKFAGASAGVKETFAGTIDRIKAAFRDLSAEIMGGAVDAGGGGWLVDAGNQLADLLRWAEKLPTPVLEVAAALGALGGASALGIGALLLVVPQVMQTVTAFKALSASFPAITAAAGPAGAALALFALAAGAVLSDVASWSADVEAYAQALALAGDAGEEAARKQAAQALAGQGVVDMMKEIGLQASTATDAALGDAAARETIIETYDREIAKLRDLSDEKFKAGQGGEAEIAAADNLLSAKNRLLDMTDKEIEKQTASADVHVEQAELMQETAEAAVVAAGALDGYIFKTEELSEAQVKWMQAVSDASGSFVNVVGAWDAVIAKEKAAAEATAENTKSSKDAWDDYYDGHTVALADYLAELQAQVNAQAAWQANMVALAGKVSDGTIEALARLGPEGAPLVQSLVDGTAAQLKEFETNFGRAGSASGAEFAAKLEAAGPILRAVSTKLGQGAVAGVAAEISSGKYTLQQIISGYDLQATIDANAAPAISAAQAAVSRINSMTATITIRKTVIGGGPGIEIPASVGGWTGGSIGDIAAAHGLAGGGMPRQPAGVVTGPGTPTSDGVVGVSLSRREFVTNALATDYYGHDFMYALNDRRIPRERFRDLGLADGGSPSRTYRSAPAFSGISAASSVSMDPSAISSAVAAGMANARIFMDGKEINARIETSLSRTARQVTRGAA